MQNSLKYNLQGCIDVRTFCPTASSPLFVVGESKKMGSRDKILGSKSLKPALISPHAFETKARHLPSCSGGSPVSVKCCVCMACMLALFYVPSRKMVKPKGCCPFILLMFC